MRAGSKNCEWLVVIAEAETAGKKVSYISIVYMFRKEESFLSFEYLMKEE
jgi:hypothetical protein